MHDTERCINDRHGAYSRINTLSLRPEQNRSTAFHLRAVINLSLPSSRVSPPNYQTNMENKAQTNETCCNLTQIFVAAATKKSRTHGHTALKEDIVDWVAMHNGSRYSQGRVEQPGIAYQASNPAPDFMGRFPQVILVIVLWGVCVLAGLRLRDYPTIFLSTPYCSRSTAPL